MIILLSAIDVASNLWQQLEVASELISDLRDIAAYWGKKWLVSFIARKNQLVSFDC